VLITRIRLGGQRILNSTEPMQRLGLRPIPTTSLRSVLDAGPDCSTLTFLQSVVRSFTSATAAVVVSAGN
jgi:hypothetical protein